MKPYDKKFKEEAVKFSDDIGVKNAAEKLGMSYHTLTGWRNKAKKHGETAHVGSGHKRISVENQREYELEKENEELRRSNDEVQIYVVYNARKNDCEKDCLKFLKIHEDDKTPSAWAEDEISKACELGLVLEDLQYNYSKKISREQFCNIVSALIEKKTQSTLADYAKLKSDKQVTFTDSISDTVKYCAEIGIIKGVGNDRFAPYDSLTREQAAAMLKRSAVIFGMSKSGSGTVFTDNEMISDWAADSVEFTSANGIMQGDADGNFNPQKGYTIEQAIITFYRLYNSL